MDDRNKRLSPANKDVLSWGGREILINSVPEGSLHYAVFRASAEVFKAAFLLHFFAIFHVLGAPIPHIIVQC